MQDQSKFINKKSLGQNFLIDKNILRKIVEYADLSPEDVILEVGSGMGILTRELASAGCRQVYSLEVDKRLERYLLPLENEHPEITIIWGDAVQFAYSTQLNPTPNKMIANIPYHITTPLLWNIITSLGDKGLNYFLLMVQKEAAERLCASPGTKERYPLGITIDAIGKAKRLLNVPPQAFRPIPRVDSSLLEIRINREFHIVSDPCWKRMLRTAFSHRRKKMVNNLIPIMRSIDKSDLGKILETLGIKASSRSEQLTTEQWLQFYRKIRTFILK